MSIPVLTVGTTQVLRLDDGSLQFTSGASIDDDGSRRAYSLHGGGEDALGNAHADPRDLSSRYVGVATHGGQPVVLPGGWLVSTTAFPRPGGDPDDPSTYLDAQSVPYISLPPQFERIGVGKFDLALVTYDGKSVAAVFGDVGPSHRIGEISPAAARALGIDDSPRHGGVASGVTYRIWPGSSKGWPDGVDLEAEVAKLC